MVIARAVPALAAKAARKIKALFLLGHERFAEHQMRKARFEIERHQARYGQPSRNDGDLRAAR